MAWGKLIPACSIHFMKFYEGLNVILSVTGTVMEGGSIVQVTLETSNQIQL